MNAACHLTYFFLEVENSTFINYKVMKPILLTVHIHIHVHLCVSISLSQKMKPQPYADEKGQQGRTAFHVLEVTNQELKKKK